MYNDPDSTLYDRSNEVKQGFVSLQEISYISRHTRFESDSERSCQMRQHKVSEHIQLLITW